MQFLQILKNRTIWVGLFFFFFGIFSNYPFTVTLSISFSKFNEGKKEKISSTHLGLSLARVVTLTFAPQIASAQSSSARRRRQAFVFSSPFISFTLTVFFNYTAPLSSSAVASLAAAAGFVVEGNVYFYIVGFLKIS